MAVRDILILPDKRLRLVSKPVAKIDAATRKLVEDMFETMYDAPGIGLAAIQIGEPKRIVTMDLAKKDEPKEPQVFINPEIVWSPDEKNIHEEGCLSIPEYYEEVERPAQVKVRYLDLDGKPHEIEADGLARDLHPARDRPPQRRAVHRSHLQAQARPRHQEIHQGGEAGKPAIKARRIEHAAPPDLHGHAGFRRADAARDSSGSGHDIAAVYTRAAEARRPARPGAACRRRSSARRDGSALPVLTPASLKSAEAQAAFAAHEADAAVVVAYGLILPKPILDAPPLGCFNLHASLLPRWRGAAPINRAIMAGDAETGVMVMRMDEGLDTGADRDGRARADRRRHDRGRIARRAGAARRRPDGARARRAGARHACSSRRSRPTASPMRPRSTRPRRASTGRKPWQAVHDQSAGCRRFPAPGSRLAGRRAIKVLRTTRGEGSGAPGTVLDDDLTIACGDGAVRIVEVQRAGRQPMQAEEFLRGTPVRAGHCRARLSHAPLQAHSSNTTARRSPAGRCRTMRRRCSARSSTAIAAFCRREGHGAGRRPHRRRRACARPGRACRSRQATGDTDTVRDALNAHLRPHPVAVLSAEKVADGFRRALLGDASGTISIASSTGGPISRSSAAAPGACRAGSTPRRCTRPRSGSSASTTSPRSARPNARPNRRRRRSTGSTCRATATRCTSPPSARSFLHNQVRSMVGSLVLVGDGKWRPRISPARSPPATARPAGRWRRRTAWSRSDDGSLDLDAGRLGDRPPLLDLSLGCGSAPASACSRANHLKRQARRSAWPMVACRVERALSLRDEHRRWPNSGPVDVAPGVPTRQALMSTDARAAAPHGP